MKPSTGVEEIGNKRGFCTSRARVIQRCRTYRTSQSGVSLVEILIAIIVLGLAAVSVSYMFGTAGADVDRLGKERVCLGVAQRELEELLSLPDDSPELSVGRHFCRFRRPPASPAADSGGDLFVEWEVVEIDDPYGKGQDYKKIVLTLYDDRLDDNAWPLGLSDLDAEVDPVERVITLTTIMTP
ncbi:MAG: type II secretion system protein [Deltaproteobacteria bacterium]|nr:type II secretion system protein [Deltaproteobacteria bacterium]